MLKKGTLNGLRTLFNTNAVPANRLRAMWGLYVCNGFTKEQLVAALNDKNEYVRGWAIQFLGQDTAADDPIITKFQLMAKEESSAVVRLYLSAALQRITLDKRWNLAANLIKHGEDEQDHNIPKMLWYGIEPLIAKDAKRALEMASRGELSMIKKFAARRAVDAEATNVLVTWLGNQKSADTAMLAGMRDGLEGRRDLKTPADWNSTYRKLQKQGDRNKVLSLEIAQYFGDTEAANHYFSVLRNKTANMNERQKALLALSSQQRPELLMDLPALLDENALRTHVIRAIANYDNEKVSQLLLSKYPKFSEKDKAAAIETLASRSKSGWLLAQAIKNKTIEKRDVPASVARQLRRVVGSGFVEIWGPIDQLPSNELAYKKYSELLSAKNLNNANLNKGQLLFNRTCGSCHKMYGEGGIIGPDLTGSNRSKINYLLFNVLEPSGEIQDDYKLVVITSRDGRTYSGNIIAENDRQVTMRIVGQEAVVINKSNIQSREVMPVSMMPNGLFETLTNAEVIDLVGYLSRSK
jgi:putative heme-binding domain-containing protein